MTPYAPHFGRRGVTLLEVLISVLLLGLIGQTVYQVATNGARVRVQAAWHGRAVRAAMLWRAARAEDAPWARGDEGRFPAEWEARWALEMPLMRDRQDVSPDEYWRVLRVVDEGDPGRTYEITLRLDPPPATQPAATQGGDDAAR